MSNAVTYPLKNTTDFSLTIAASSWSSGQTWMRADNNTTYPTAVYGETASVCYEYRADINCGRYDEVVITGYARQYCPSPLYVALTVDNDYNGKIVVQTATQPSQAVTITGYILHQ